MLRYLTKSKYIDGLQCPMLLWTKMNEPKKIPEADEGTERRFEEGRIVETYARQLFPGGINLNKTQFQQNLVLTEQNLKQKNTLFEAGILTGRLYCKTDVIRPSENEAWDIYEIKSSTQVKEVYIHDLSFQKHCWEKAGFTIKNCYVITVNNQYVRKGDIDISKLFSTRDITELVLEAEKGIEERIETLLSIIDSDSINGNIGMHCSSPYDCPMTNSCWSFLPENSIMTLSRGKAKALELYQNNRIIHFKDLPADFELTKNQKIQTDAVVENKEYIDTKKLNEFISKLEYPIYFMDFEAFNTAIPMYNDLKPFQHVPFQFSLHVLDNINETPKHYSFIAKSRDDPRKDFMNELKKVLGTKGSIIVYNETFEKKILNETAKIHSEFTDWVEEVNKRIVDLEKPFQNFSYYHPKQQGRTSIKYVLPAVSDLTYKGMEISNGVQASVEFLNAIHSSEDEAEKQRVLNALYAYCGLDTEAMIHVLKRLILLV